MATEDESNVGFVQPEGGEAAKDTVPLKRLIWYTRTVVVACVPETMLCHEGEADTLKLGLRTETITVTEWLIPVSVCPVKVIAYCPEAVCGGTEKLIVEFPLPPYLRVTAEVVNVGLAQPFGG